MHTATAIPDSTGQVSANPRDTPAPPVPVLIAELHQRFHAAHPGSRADETLRLECGQRVLNHALSGSQP